MKTFIVYYKGGQEFIQAYGEKEARQLFRSIFPSIEIMYIQKYWGN